MGILDDAIREHLELKRQQGVPEDELQRQQEEALGPARRDVAQQPEEIEAEETALVGDGTAPPVDEEAPVSSEPLAPEPVPEAEPTALAEPFDAETALHEQPEPTPVEPPPVEPPPVEEPPVEEPPVEEPPVEPAAEEPFGGEPFADDPFTDEEEPVGEPGHDPEAGPGADEPEDEYLDVLEDTPDFLQETPEHDRLWFEQKPPRDFDFD
jgi:hypothetical protein